MARSESVHGPADAPVQQMIITKCIRVPFSPSPLRRHRRLAWASIHPPSSFFHSGRFLNPKGLRDWLGCPTGRDPPIFIDDTTPHPFWKAASSKSPNNPPAAPHVLLASPKRPYPGEWKPGIEGKCRSCFRRRSNTIIVPPPTATYTSVFHGSFNGFEILGWPSFSFLRRVSAEKPLIGAGMKGPRVTVDFWWFLPDGPMGSGA